MSDIPRYDGWAWSAVDEIERLRSITLHKTDKGKWVWADRAGWGDGVFDTVMDALTAARNATIAKEGCIPLTKRATA